MLTRESLPIREKQCYVHFYLPISFRIWADFFFNIFISFQGMKILSPRSVSFHYVDPGHAYYTDFLLYDLKRAKINKRSDE